jgi:hypothetical protein
MARRTRPDKASLFNFKVELSPSPIELARMYAKAAEGLSDFSPTFPKVAKIIASETAASVENQGSQLGAKWPKLSDARSKRKSRGGGPPLQNKGRYLAALRKMGILWKTKMSVAVGLRGKIAQQGAGLNWGTRKPQNMPGRLHWGWTTRMSMMVLRVFSDHRDKVVDKAMREMPNPKKAR